MNTLQNELELTPQTIIEAFKLLGLDNSQTKNRLNDLSEQPEKRQNDEHRIITSDNTLEPKEGKENA